jgi:hypothetical protein
MKENKDWRMGEMHKWNATASECMKKKSMNKVSLCLSAFLFSG